MFSCVRLSEDAESLSSGRSEDGSEGASGWQFAGRRVAWLALGVLAGVVCIVIVAVAALMFPSRRADLYQASPANLKAGGIPVLYVVASLAIVVMAFLVW